MARARIVLSFVTFFLFCIPAGAQQPPVQDPAAVAAMQAAVTAMGGTAAVAAIQNSVAQGTSVDAGDGGPPANFTWTYSGSDFRNENDDTTGSHILVSNSGSPCDLEGASSVPFGPQVARANLPFHIPAQVLFNELGNPNYTLTYAGLSTVNGASAVHVQTADNSDSIGQLATPQDWYFDASSYLPIQVQYRLPDPINSQNWLAATINFGSFQAVNGVLVPFQLTVTEGPIAFTATAASVVFNTTISPSEFSASCGGGQ
jgi:hypothetical protein